MNARSIMPGDATEQAVVPMRDGWSAFLRGYGNSAGRDSGTASELGVAALLIAVATIARMLVDEAIPGVVPYIFVYPAIAAAVLFSSPKAGLFTLIGCQLLVWYAVVPTQWSFYLADRSQSVSLLLSTLAELILLGILATYHAAVRDRARRAAGRVEEASFALKELDHRTKNNLQLMQSILFLKAQRSSNPEVKRELTAAGARIGIVGSMNSFLVRSGANLSHVALQPYLGTVCRHLKESLCPEGIALECDFVESEIDNDRALYLGLILNELVTNAIKHAFPDGKGAIRATLTRDEDRLTLIVGDNGCGKAASAEIASRGLGSRLMHMMVGRVRGTLQELSGTGTTYRIDIPI